MGETARLKLVRVPGELDLTHPPLISSLSRQVLSAGFPPIIYINPSSLTRAHNNDGTAFIHRHNKNNNGDSTCPYTQRTLSVPYPTPSAPYLSLRPAHLPPLREVNGRQRRARRQRLDLDPDAPPAFGCEPAFFTDNLLGAEGRGATGPGSHGRPAGRDIKQGHLEPIMSSTHAMVCMRCAYSM